MKLMILSAIAVIAMAGCTYYPAYRTPVVGVPVLAPVTVRLGSPYYGGHYSPYPIHHRVRARSCHTYGYRRGWY